jgi:phage shock protein A
MSLGRRLALMFRTKASKILDRAEDPREILDYSYQRQLELLQQVRRGVADVATSRKRLELQVRQLQDSADRLSDQARRAVAAGRDDLAREALRRRAGVTGQLDDLGRQHASLQAEEERLTLAAQRLQATVEAFRTRKETVKATYTAAEAQTKIGEAVAGVSEEMGDVGLAIQRAADKTQQMQARAGAIDELLASGALDDATVSGPRDDIQAELDRLSATADVDRELAAIKGGQPAANPARAIGSTPPDAARDHSRPEEKS